MFRILDKEKRGEVNTDELRSSLLFDAFLSYFLVSLRFFIICPIAVAYSMGQIIKSVCLKCTRIAQIYAN